MRRDNGAGRKCGKRRSCGIEVIDLRKAKIHEYRAKIEERERWMTRFWKERLTYICIIIGFVVGLVSIVIVMLT